MTGAGNNVADGGNGNDLLIGGGGESALFGGQGRDVLLAGAGTDLVVGGQGNDLLDTGTGVSTHLGGQGADTFRIGDEILDNNAFDRIVALDFDPGEDVLRLGDDILAGLGDAQIQDVSVSKALILQQIEQAGVHQDFEAALGQVSDGEAVERDLLAVLEDLPAELDAARVTLANGDEIITLGVTAAQLTDLLA